jgi:hypothetical protein
LHNIEYRSHTIKKINIDYTNGHVAASVSIILISQDDLPFFFFKICSSYLISYTINYEGWRGEHQFAKYTLQNAQLLKVMKINISLTFYSRTIRDPLEELTFCPTISPKCKLSIDSWYMKEDKIVSLY